MYAADDTQMTEAQHYAKAEELLTGAEKNGGAMADRFVAMAHVHAILASTKRPHDVSYGRAS